MKMIFVFKSQNENFNTLAIKADTVENAMQIIVEDWYTHFFHFDFSVTIITGTSGI